MRLAALDIGSNALRFAAAEFAGPDDYRVLDSDRVPVRLGSSAPQGRRLDPERIGQAVVAIEGFHARIRALGVARVRAVATSAVRDSENGSELIERVRRATGIELLPISGVEEGALVWRAIRARIPESGGRWLLADLGGGSLELSLAQAETLWWTESLPLGTVRLLDTPGGGESMVDSLAAHIERSVAPVVARSGESHLGALIATGGNADILADLAGAHPDDRGVRQLTRAQLMSLVDRIAGLSVRERIERLRLPADRGDVILPAAIVYERLARLAGTDAIIVPGVGLKEGVLLALMDDVVEGDRAAALEEAAMLLGRRYGFDEVHARQVARLSLGLYDALQPLHRLGQTDRRILLAAALLHDIGKVVATRKHHKHSRYLIRHAELPGLSRAETNLVSLVARYHRGTRPKRSQKGYGGLEGVDRKRVKTLAALLRLADALDHDHRQAVREVTATVSDLDVVLHPVSAAGTDVDPETLARKGKLFERVFDRRLHLEAVEAAAPILNRTDRNE